MIYREFPAMVVKTGDTAVQVPVMVELNYYPDCDPFAVEMAIGPDTDEPKLWHFSRSLLIDALAGQVAGKGDVRFTSLGPDTMMMCLKNQNGHADILMPSRELQIFLEDTLDELEEGEEEVNGQLDEVLAEILS